MGSAAYAPEKDALVWKIKSFPGGKVWLTSRILSILLLFYILAINSIKGIFGCMQQYFIDSYLRIVRFDKVNINDTPLRSFILPV